MTQDQEKSEAHLLNEVRELRQQVAELQATTALCRQTEAALRQKTAFVELLKVVAATSHEGVAIESVMQVCLEQICRHLGWPIGHVYRVAEDNSQELVSTKLWHLAHPDQFAAFCRVTEDLRFAKGEGLPGRVMAAGKPLWIADLTKDTEFPRATQAMEVGLKAGFGIPVLVGGEVTAVLEFFSLEPTELDDQLLGVMAHIGTQLGRLSERKRAEATRRESEERYRAILTNIEDGYCEIDLKGNFTFFNDAICTIFGYSPEELMGMNYRQYTEPEAVPRLFQIYNDTYRTGKSSGASGYRIFRKDGTARFVETSASLIRDAAGQPAGFLGILRDVTERKQTEEVLRQSEERYRTIIEDLTDAYWEMDLSGKFTYFNDQLIEQHRRSAEELTGLSYKSYMGEETVNRVFKDYNHLYRTGEPIKGLTHEQYQGDGTLTYVESNVSLIRDGEGKPVGFRGISRDVTQWKQTEAALQESKDYLDRIINTIADPIFVKDRQHRFVLLNDAFCQFVGQTREAMLGKTVAIYCPPDEAAAIIEKDNLVFANGSEKSFEDYFIDVEGNHHVILTKKTIYEAQDGEKFLVGVIRDITELKQTEEELKLSEERYRTIIEEMTDSYWELDLAAKFTFFNNQVMIEQKRSREELLALKPGDSAYIDEENSQKVAQAYQQIYLTGEAARGLTFEMIRGDGTKYTIESSVSLIKDKQGKPIGFRGISRDVTMRLQTEEALRQSEERYRTIIEDMTEAYWEMDLGGKSTYFNDRLIELHRRSAEELMGLSYKEYLDEETIEKVSKMYNQLYRTGEPIKGLIHEQYQGDSTLIYVESNVSLIRDVDGKPVGFRGISRDVTKRLQTEEALRQSEERYRTIIENANDIIYTTDLKGNFTSLNRSGERLTGYSREDIVHLNYGHLVAPDQLELAQKRLQFKAELGHVFLYEIDIITKSGQRSSLEINSRQVLDDGKPVGFHGIARDITERKQAEEALKRSEERYRSIIEDMTEAYWEMDLSGTFTFCNHQLVLEHQRSREELIGLNNKQYMDEEEVKKVGKIFKQIYLTREPAREVAYEMTKGDGTKYCVESNVSLIIDEEGNPVGFRGVNRDVTKRKQAELELQRAKETAEAASRAKSEFLANMSHEIRTPINGILGMTELALDTRLSSEQREYLDLVKTSADALISIINDILDFSKIEAGKLDLDFVNFNLRHTLNDTMKTLALRAHQKELNLVCQVLPEIPDALIGDSGRLRQILLNLVGNAIKFTDKGEIRVGVEVEMGNPEESLLHFTVSDTGIGIPPDKQEIIFEAFSQSDGSTTRRYGGTGLGLTISSQLVAMMGGKIWVESQPEQGSTFHFTARFGIQKEESLPAVSRPELSWSIELALAAPESRRPYHILLAEDNLVNQRLAVRLLEKKGHSVVVAENGRKAVTAFENEPFDLILMDMQMPELNGYEATAIIREKEQATNQHIPIIALTAHTMKGDRERCLAAGMDGYVSKPIKIEELFETIEEFAPLETITVKSPPGESLVNEVIDRQAILYHMDGDEELFQELAEMFLDQCPPLLAKIQEAIAQSNSQELEHAAHKLKGSIATFEAKCAYEAALTLETMGRKNDLSEAAKAGLTLTAEMERLQQALFNLR